MEKVRFSLLEEFELLAQKEIQSFSGATFSAKDDILITRKDETFDFLLAGAKLESLGQLIAPTSCGGFDLHPKKDLLAKLDEHILDNGTRKVFLRYWSFPGAILVNELPLPGYGPGDVCFSTDGKWLIAFCGERFFIISMQTGRIEYEMPGGEYSFGLAFLDQTVMTAIYSQADIEIGLYDFPFDFFPYKSVPDESSYKGEIWWENWHHNQEVKLLRIHHDLLAGAMLSRDKALVAISHGHPEIYCRANRKRIHSWDVNGQLSQPFGEYRVKYDYLWSNPVFTTDSNTLICGSPYGVLYCWDTEKGKNRISIQAHQGQIGNLAISHNGKLLSSIGADGWLKLWRLST